VDTSFRGSFPCTDRAFVWPWNRPWPRLPRDFDVLKQEITDTQAKLVVLDPLAAFLEFDSALTNDGAASARPTNCCGKSSSFICSCASVARRAPLKL
jgi:hypothetical protein